MKLKLTYGTDTEPGPGGFFWPSSPSKRKELMSVRRNHPAIFESVYQGRPGRRQGAIFLEEDFVYYDAPKRLHMGISDPEVAEFCRNFYLIVAGWDTAMEATHESNHTVGIVAGFRACDKYHRGEDPLIYGECEPHLDVYLLDLVRKKLQFGDLAAEFRSFHRKWTPMRHVVEKKGSGIFLYQSMPAVGIHVEGVDTNASKRTRAVNGVEAGSTQGWFRQWRVRAPHKADWLPAFKTELKDFTGDDDADDDQVDAVVHLTNHAIETGNSMAIMSSEWSPENIDQLFGDQEGLPDPSLAYLPPRAELLSWIQLAPEFSADPFSECCANCTRQKDFFCAKQKRKVASLDLCEFFDDARAVAAI